LLAQAADWPEQEPERDAIEFNHHRAFRFLIEHDLFGKPVATIGSWPKAMGRVRFWGAEPRGKGAGELST
jgi:hypothetical protein